MEILGIGPSELFFIIIIALIVLGPRDMQKAGKTVGRWLNNLVKSDGWKAFQQTSKEIRTLPTKLMREANLETADMEKEVRNAMDMREKPSASSPSRKPSPLNEPVNTIQSPTVKTPAPDTEQHG
jgi:sec-independent protein translocase protein TatB